MSSSQTQASATGTHSLGTELTIYQAGEVHNVLCELMKFHEEMEVDLSAVEDIDSAGIQALMHLHELALRKKKSLRMVRHSPAVLEVLALFNLEAYFGDPLVLPAAGGAA